MKNYRHDLRDICFLQTQTLIPNCGQEPLSNVVSVESLEFQLNIDNCSDNIAQS